MSARLEHVNITVSNPEATAEHGDDPPDQFEDPGRRTSFRSTRPNVRMYVCGPTVYDRAHLGNARPVVVFDTLYRLLRHVYGPDHVTYVRNFTDVDDKINAEALAPQAAGDPRTLEELIRQRTEETIAWYHADMDALGALRPDA
jgi:cysteinyl-tRNA synthetase